jgi:hypothetical protein
MQNTKRNINRDIVTSRAMQALGLADRIKELAVFSLQLTVKKQM